MKTKTTITELTHEDIVDLLCTATYGSEWLEIFATDRKGLDIADGDCREDVWAKALLAGKKLEIIDHFADGEIYSDLGQIDDEGNSGIYLIGLEDVRKGLESAFDAEGEDKEWHRECAQDFLKGDGSMDQHEAECLVQFIIFGEEIYG